MFGKARYKLSLLVDLFENIEESIFEIRNSDDSKALIVELNTYGQLFEGKTADGGDTGVYSPYTIEFKKSQGKPYDRVTLNQDGDFYDSFEVVVRKNETIIIADTVKADKDLVDEFGKIIGLNEESLQKYRVFLKKALLQVLHKEIRAIKN